MVLLAANHIVTYSKEVADELEQHCRDLARNLQVAELSLLVEPAMITAPSVAKVSPVGKQENFR